MKGKTISDYSQDELVFNNPLIFRLCLKRKEELIKLEEISELDLEGKDCIIFRTGFKNTRNEDPDTYLTLNPGIEPELVHWIRKSYPKIRCIGIDCISISSFQKPEQGKKAHLNALRKMKSLENHYF